jgi:serine/threonine protein kinase/Tfp pilus assembly protein PilF
MTEEALFLAALEKATPAERQAFLDDACGADADLRARIDKLLEADAQSHGILDGSVPVGATVADRSDAVGKVIAGRYKLLEQIGEGGMGTVWVAEQTEPVRRKVALKLIKTGMDSKSVFARFEAERQALALMDHPNIAKVLDGGITGSEPGGVSPGRPFFVMEYVKGVTITAYCDSARLSVPERLQLFAQVCHAVQHAHQKGIIHRDLKPSNILVAPYDERPVPKVIDFGLAKAMNQSLTEHTLHTAHEMVLGTPLYMSPEQAQLNNLDVDTRTDIYSLGVLLYELLTGTTPLERKRFKEAAWDEVRRMIREEEPPRPSTRLSSTGTLASLAACRRIEPARLTKLVRGELDWIVMKALEKERGRRYETANGFAMDVLRYLAGEPVLAVPPSSAYRLRKFARKHRAVLATAAVITLLLAAGIVGTTLGLFRARAAEHDALLAQAAEADRADGERKAKQDAEDAAAAEKAANEQAQKRLTQIKKGNEIITSIFEDLNIEKVKAGTEPLEAVLARRLLKAANQLDGDAVGDPLDVAYLQHGLGRCLRSLGYSKEAIPLFAHAYETFRANRGPDNSETLIVLNNFALANEEAGNLDAALPQMVECLRLTRIQDGAESESTIKSMNNLAGAYRAVGRLDRALPLWKESWMAAKLYLGPDNSTTLTSMNNLAEAYQENGDYDLSLPLLDECLKLTSDKYGPKYIDTLTGVNNLAMGYFVAGRFDAALPLEIDCLRLRKAHLGLEHPDTLAAMNNLAQIHQAMGRLDLAMPLLEESFKLSKERWGVFHPSTMTATNNLARGYLASGKRDLALRLQEDNFKVAKDKWGVDHPGTLNCMNNLARAYQENGRLDLALPLLEETLRLSTERIGADHPDTLVSMNNLAFAYNAANKRDLALPLFQKALALRKARLGENHPATLTSANNLGMLLYELGKQDEAMALFQVAALGAERRRFQLEHAGSIVMNLVVGLERREQFAEAETWRRKWLEVVKERSGADSVPYANELVVLAANLFHQQKWPDAEPLLRASLEIREKNLPDSWSTFNTKSMLGGALLGQKKYTDAEPLLLAGHEGLKERVAKIPSAFRKVRITETVERLVQLYDALDNKDEAAKWRKELEEVKKAFEKAP